MICPKCGRYMHLPEPECPLCRIEERCAKSEKVPLDIPFLPAKVKPVMGANIRVEQFKDSYGRVVYEDYI